MSGVSGAAGGAAAAGGTAAASSLLPVCASSWRLDQALVSDEAGEDEPGFADRPRRQLWTGLLQKQREAMMGTTAGKNATAADKAAAAASTAADLVSTSWCCSSRRTASCPWATGQRGN